MALGAAGLPADRRHWLALGLLRVHDPRIRLRAWHGVVIVCLLLPLLQTWQSTASPASAGDTIEPQSLADWSFWIALAILAGVALRIGWLASGLFRLRRVRLRADPWRPIPSWFGEVTKAVGASADVSVSADVESAVTFGLRRPAILVPRDLPDAPASHQRAVLAHELTHVARRDWLWVLGEETVRTMFWCHPAMWFALGEAQLAREEVVDRRAIAATGSRDGYLEALVAAAAPAPAAALGFGPQFYRRRQLEIRIRRLLKENAMSRKQLIAMAGVLAFMVPATVMAGGRAFPLVTIGDVVQQVPPPPPPPPPPAPPAPAVKQKPAQPKEPPPPPPPPPPRVPPAAKAERVMPPPPPPVPPAKAVAGTARSTPPPPPPAVPARPADATTPLPPAAASDAQPGKAPAPPPPPPAPARAAKRGIPPPPPPPPPAPPIPGRGRGGR